MKVTRCTERLLFGLGFCCLIHLKCLGFALLGPYEPWMQYSNSFRQPGDIGGPMPMGCEYRWNVPVITYGFDQTFIDYFGSEGVSEVEAAIQMINGLPRASDIVLSNFPVDTTAVNFPAIGEGVHDLKSAAMTRLLKALGLAQPVRSVFVLHHWDSYLVQFPDEAYWDEWFYDWYIFRRNFDPGTALGSQWVNGGHYFGHLVLYEPEGRGDVLETLADPLGIGQPAVADGFEYPNGLYYTGFTRDDVGGLGFLLSSNNVNFEFLLPGVRGAGSNAVDWTDGAWRPGVEKVTFAPHPGGSNQWLTMTAPFADAYLINGMIVTQQLERVVSEPDIVFSAVNNAAGPFPVSVNQTDTSGWVNNASANGNANGAGPGVIRPPINIAFQKMGGAFASLPPTNVVQWEPWWRFTWGTVDASSTNAGVKYPVPSYTGNGYLEVNFGFVGRTPPQSVGTWRIALDVGAIALLQRSTNLTDWESLTAITNTGAAVGWSHYRDAQIAVKEFFRVIPQ